MRKFHLLSGLVLSGMACLGQSARAEPDIQKVSARIFLPAPKVVRTATPVPVITETAESAKEAHDAKDAAPACPDGRCRRPICWSVYGDYLLLTARNESIPYAQVRDGDTPLAVPRGETGNIETEYSSGFRAGFQAVLNSSVVVNVGFSRYDTRNTDNITVPANQPFVIHALTTHPNTINAAADSLSADANLNLRFYTGEIDFRYGLCGTDCGHLALILGGRYGHLDQDFTGRYSLLGATTVNTAINFDGGGPRIGLVGSYKLFRNVSVYGRSDVSLLFGHVGATYSQVNVFAGEQAATSFSDDRFVPLWENELGVSWKNTNGRIEVTAGYTSLVWFNALTTSSWIQGVQDASFSGNRDNMQDTLTFDGLFARIAFKF